MLFDRAIERFAKTNQASLSDLVNEVDSMRIVLYDIAAHTQGITEKLLRQMGYDLVDDPVQKRLMVATVAQHPHLRTIWNTALQTIYTVGRWNRFQASGRVNLLRYDAVNDSKTRPSHRALDNYIAPKDSPVWRTIYPPNGYNCRCVVRPVTMREARERYGYDPNNPPPLPQGGVDEGFDRAFFSVTEYAQFMRQHTEDKYRRYLDNFTRLAFMRIDDIRTWAQSYVASRWPNFNDDPFVPNNHVPNEVEMVMQVDSLQRYRIFDWRANLKKPATLALLIGALTLYGEDVEDV